MNVPGPGDFTLDIKDGASDAKKVLCSQELKAIKCSDGYEVRFKTQEGGQQPYCKKTVRRNSTCGVTGQDWVTQKDSRRSMNSQLTVTVRVKDSIQEPQQIKVSPAMSTLSVPLEADGKATLPLTLGQWQIEYRSGTEVCQNQTLKPVACSVGHHERDRECVEDASTASSNLQKVLGVCIGVVLTAVVLYFGYIGR